MPSNRQRLILNTIAATLAVTGLAAAAVGGIVLRAGWYDISAIGSHWQPVYTLLESGMHYSVRNHASGIVVPKLGEPQQLKRGAALYAANCAQCHGGPGFAQAPIGQSMQPVPGPLIDAGKRWAPRELYWITRNGIKMSGMPAWEYHMSEADTWAVVAFMQTLPGMSARDYGAATNTPVNTATPVTAPMAEDAP